MADFDSSDVGNRVERAGRAADRQLEITLSWL
jgi:hypothetical protein